MSKPTENALTIRRYYKNKTAAGDKRASVWLSHECRDQIEQLMVLRKVNRDALIALLVSEAAGRLGVK